jgi:hypothetical protein
MDGAMLRVISARTRIPTSLIGDASGKEGVDGAQPFASVCAGVTRQ